MQLGLGFALDVVQPKEGRHQRGHTGHTPCFQRVSNAWQIFAMHTLNYLYDIVLNGRVVRVSVRHKRLAKYCTGSMMRVRHRHIATQFVLVTERD
jgi:hypothetical protein